MLKMESFWIISAILILLRVANAAAVDGSVIGDVHIPPLIRRMFHKMSAVMEQGDLDISLKYLRTVKTIHWLEPITHVADGDESNGYYYTFVFNASGLSGQEQPTNVQLHLRMETTDQPAVIKVNASQQETTWRQPELSDKDAKKTTDVLSVKISLQLANSSSSHWTNDMLTVKVASTNPIKIPSKKRHQSAVGLLLYMGGVPEAINNLLEAPIDKSAHLITDKKERYKIGEGKRDINTPCQLKEGLKVKFSEVGGGYEYIIQPLSLDIKQCVGECPHLLHHLHNPSEHAEVRNLLAFREGSASADALTASCVATSFKPQPIVMYNPISKMVSYKSYDELVAASCGCR